MAIARPGQSLQHLAVIGADNAPSPNNASQGNVYLPSLVGERRRARPRDRGQAVAVKSLPIRTKEASFSKRSSRL